MDDVFHRTLFPPRVRVLGRWLPPLSFWHLACLQALESPFIRGGDIALADIQLGVKIAFTRWPAPPPVRRTWREAAQRWLYDRSPSYVRREAEAFSLWRQLHELRPEFWEREDQLPRLLTAPAILARVAQLERLTKFTHAEAWNDLTPGYASWLISTIQEQQGAELRFVRDEDDENDELPDLTTMTEDELCAYIAQDLGAAEANAFMQRRARAREKEGA